MTSPGPHPPYWVPTPPPPRRKRSRWLTVGLPVVGGLLLLGGCGALVLRFLTTVGGELGRARQAAESYAQALVDARWEDAHASLCAEVQADVTVDELAAHYTDPDVTEYGLDGVNVRTSNSGAAAEATVTLVHADGLQHHQVLPLVDEDGSWGPCP